jgi:RNA polymerase sigma-54 factor
MKQGLSLRVSQHLALTPQLQQSIRLLQLSTLELGQEVEQMLDDNPFLERQDDIADREAFGLAQADAPVSLGDSLTEVAIESAAEKPYSSSDEGVFESKSTAVADDVPGSAADDASVSEPDWEGDGTVDIAPDDSEWGSDAPARGNTGGDDDQVSAADLAFEHVTLQAHLHRQALGMRLSDTDRAALYVLIESLDDDGYLADPLDELARALEPGDEAADPDLLLRREELTQHLRMALGWLQHMEPAGVGARDLAECLRLQIEEMRNTPVARTALAIAQPRRDAAPEGARRLRQRPARRPWQGRGRSPHAAALQEARWFIKNIQQRFDTILRVSNAIVERQNFFVHGELAMRPLVLREIADELGLHESTISRVTTAKYMATPFGTFELKYFFGSGLGTETGGNASSTAVRALIKQLVAAERPQKAAATTRSPTC